MKPTNDLLDETEELQNLLISHATGGAASEDRYRELRAKLIATAAVSDKLPRFVHTSRDLHQFWQFIKQRFGSYAERRAFLYEQFQPVLLSLERDPGPADQEVTEVLAKFTAGAVREAWNKALARRADDPEAAVTSARTLLETVCKHILDEAGGSYEDAWDLPKLYRATSEQLDLAPSQHSESTIRQILGGCAAVVEGLGALRNRLSDAHGRGTGAARPSSRHAQLAVNLAGAMSTFLFETWDVRKDGIDSPLPKPKS